MNSRQPSPEPVSEPTSTPKSTGGGPSPPGKTQSTAAKKSPSTRPVRIAIPRLVWVSALLAGCVALLVAWFVLPRGQGAEAIVEITRQRESWESSARTESDAEYRRFRDHQMFLLSGKWVISEMLRNEASLAWTPLLANRAQPADWIMHQLRVQPLGDTELISVAFYSRNATAACALLNSLMETYALKIAQGEGKAIQAKLQILDEGIKAKSEELSQMAEQYSSACEKLGIPITPDLYQARYEMLMQAANSKQNEVVSTKVYFRQLEDRVQVVQEQLRTDVPSATPTPESMRMERELAVLRRRQVEEKGVFDRLRTELDVAYAELDKINHTNMEVIHLRDEMDALSREIGEYRRRKAIVELDAKQRSRIRVVQQAEPLAEYGLLRRGLLAGGVGLMAALGTAGFAWVWSRLTRFPEHAVPPTHPPAAG